MYHSITFRKTVGSNIITKNTWDDWHLIPASRPLVNPPSVKTSYVDIPGGDGALDLTESLSGRAMYGNRSGSWDFYVDNDHQDWTVLYSQIMAFLHGQTMKIVFEDDLAYYYEGRFSVNEWRSEKSYSRIIINYALEPYKYFIETDDKWLWDPFNFETGIVLDIYRVAINGELVIQIPITNIGPTGIHPVITTTVKGVTAYYNGNSYNLKKGRNDVTDMQLAVGSNRITFQGNGRVSVELVGGVL